MHTQPPCMFCLYRRARANGPQACCPHENRQRGELDAAAMPSQGRGRALPERLRAPAPQDRPRA